MRSFTIVRIVGVAMITIGAVANPVRGRQETAPSGDLRSYYTANGMLERGLNAMAIEEYLRFLEGNGKHEKARAAQYGLAIAYSRTEDWRSALDALESIESINEFEYGVDAAQLAAHCATRLGSHEKARAWCLKGLGENPDEDEASKLTAALIESLWRLEDWSEVTSAADQFRRDWPNHSNRSRVEYFAGVAAQRQGEHDLAVRAFQYVLSNDPESALADHARLALASSIRSEDDPAGAEIALREASKSTNPQVAESARFQLVELLLDRGAEAEALAILEQIVELNPTGVLAPQAADEMARLAIELGRESVARKAIAFLLRLNLPEWADDAAYWRGKLAQRRRDLDESISIWNTALREFPGSNRQAVMLYDLGVALHATGRRSDAIDRWNAIRSEHSDDRLAADATYGVMSALSEEGDWAAARRAAVEFLDRWPRHERASTVSFQSAEYLSHAGDDAGAVREFDEWIKRHPEHPQRSDAELRLGLALVRLSRPTEAQSVLTPLADRATEEPRYAPAALAMADLAFQRADWPEAERRLTQYLSITEESSAGADVRLQLGLSIARQGRHAEAIEVFERILTDRTRPSMQSRVHFELGQSREARGDDSAAASSFIASLRVDSESSVADHARMRLGSIARRAGRHAEAAKWFGEVDGSGDASAYATTASLERARALLAAEQTDEAANAFRSWLVENESDPRASEARGGLVVALSRAGDLDAARVELQRIDARELDEPARSTLLLEAAWVHRRLDAPSEATRLYALVADGDGSIEQRAHALTELSSIALEADRLDDAANHLQSLEQLTSSGDALSSSVAESIAYLRGVVAWRQNRWGDAVAALDGFSAHYAESDVVHAADLILAEAQSRLERWSEADRTLARLLDSNPDESTLRSAVLRAAEVEASLQKWAASEQSARRFIDRFGDDDPLWYQAQFNLARALESQNKYEDAIEAYRRLIDQHSGPTAARAQFQIGECLYALGRFDEAARELIRVDILYDQPEWTAAALYEAGRCFVELNQHAEGRAQFDSVIQRFPDTNWALLAREQKQSLDAESRLPGR